MIKEFAEYYSLTVWDWITALMALISLIIGIKTYLISRKTLASQKKTEENTIPIITKPVLEYTLYLHAKKILNDVIIIKAAISLFKDNNNKVCLSEIFWNSLLLDIDAIHREMYYKKASSEFEITQLYENSIYFNQIVKHLMERTSMHSVDEETVNRLYQILKGYADILLYSFFNLKIDFFNADRGEVFKWFFNFLSPGIDKSNNISTNYFPLNDVFSKYGDKVIFYMNEKVEKQKKELSLFLITK